MAGQDWKQLIEQIAPLVGSLGAGEAKGAFMQGYQQQMQIVQQERQRREQEAQRKNESGAKFELEAANALSEITDPEEFLQRRDLYQHAGTHAFGLAPDALNRLTLSEKKVLAAKQKKAEEKLNELIKLYGPDVVDAHVSVPFDGKMVTPQDLLGVLELTATESQTRKPYARKATTSAGTVDERAAKLLGQIRQAKTTGDTSQLDALQAEYDDLIKAKTDLGGAGRAPVDPDIAEMNKTLKQLQIDAAHARASSGGETQDLSNQLKQLQIDAAQSKVDDAKQATQAKRASAVRMATDLTSEIDKLLDPLTGKLTPAAQSIVGMRMPFASSVPGSNAANAMASLKRIQGQMVIDLMNEMKAQSRTGATGFGALSERELDLIRDAASKLSNRNMSEDAFAAELKRIRDNVGLVDKGKNDRIYYDANGRPMPAASH